MGVRGVEGWWCQVICSRLKTVLRALTRTVTNAGRGRQKVEIVVGRGRVMHRCRDDKTGMQTMQADSTLTNRQGSGGQSLEWGQEQGTGEEECGSGDGCFGGAVCGRDDDAAKRAGNSLDSRHTLLNYDHSMTLHARAS
jgi:hypothetical protein